MTRTTKRPLRRLAALALPIAFALGLAAAAPARAVDFGVRAGGYLDEHDPFVGLELFVPFSSRGWAFDPNVEFVFADARDRASLNADFRYDFLADSNYAIFGGAGLALIHLDGTRGRDDENDVGANLFGGVDWRLDRFTPYAQLKVVVADDSEVALGVGIRF